MLVHKRPTEQSWTLEVSHAKAFVSGFFCNLALLEKDASTQPVIYHSIKPGLYSHPQATSLDQSYVCSLLLQQTFIPFSAYVSFFLLQLLFVFFFTLNIFDTPLLISIILLLTELV